MEAMSHVGKITSFLILSSTALVIRDISIVLFCVPQYDMHARACLVYVNSFFFSWVKAQRVCIQVVFRLLGNAGFRTNEIELNIHSELYMLLGFIKICQRTWKVYERLLSL